MSETITKAITLGIFAVLLVITFFLIKPFITALLTTAILAWIFHPIYIKINKKINNPNFSASIISFGLIIFSVVLLWFASQLVVKEVVNFYSYTQTHDIAAPIKTLFAGITENKEVFRQISFYIDKIIEKGTSYVLNYAGNLIVNIPAIMIQLFVVFFVLFFFLRDGNQVTEYIKEILPFKKTAKEQFFVRFNQITKGTIYGTIIVGILQGIAAGLGYLFFGVGGVLLLTIASIFMAILPFFGTWFIWVPVGVMMIIGGNTSGGIGLLIYNTIAISLIDFLVRPALLGKHTKMSQAVILLGMLGGINLFGAIGIIIGPLILDYLIIFIEFYRTKKMTELIE